MLLEDRDGGKFQIGWKGLIPSARGVLRRSLLKGVYNGRIRLGSVQRLRMVAD
jgi:hypothetical protein